jgi:hypothetical protein
MVVLAIAWLTRAAALAAAAVLVGAGLLRSHPLPLITLLLTAVLAGLLWALVRPAPVRLVELPCLSVVLVLLLVGVGQLGGLGLVLAMVVVLDAPDVERRLHR